MDSSSFMQPTIHFPAVLSLLSREGSSWRRDTRTPPFSPATSSSSGEHIEVFPMKARDIRSIGEDRNLFIPISKDFGMNSSAFIHLDYFGVTCPVEDICCTYCRCQPSLKHIGTKWSCAARSSSKEISQKWLLSKIMTLLLKKKKRIPGFM